MKNNFYVTSTCLDYIMKTSIDTNTSRGFTLTEAKSRRYPKITITDVDYADDLAIITDNIKDAETLLQQIEKSAKQIGLYTNEKKTEFIKYNQNGMIKSGNGHDIKSVNDFKYLGS